MTGVPTWTVEGNADLAALGAWLAEHRGAAARLTREPSRRGYLTAQATRKADGTTRTTISLRDPRRGARSQYRTVHALDEIEIRTEGGRYRPAREVLGVTS